MVQKRFFSLVSWARYAVWKLMVKKTCMYDTDSSLHSLNKKWSLKKPTLNSNGNMFASVLKIVSSSKK